ncbi:MAG TPA: TonB family protein [Candidatus Acidoferrales bacterium]|nr:TonB family protein [Candidatus Acidoferrales bacterium]
MAALFGALVLMVGLAPRASADAPSYYEPPHFKVQVKPNYPDSARAKHETGVVFVKVLVAQDGSVKSVTIAKSSGHKDLDDEVLRVAKISTYAPATRNGQATTAFYDYSYQFTLAGLSENTAQSSDLSKQLATDPKNVVARLSLIDSALGSTDYAKAESLADQGVQLLPDDARLWTKRGQAYYDDGSANHDTAKLKIAVDSYDRANSLKPGVAPASVTAAAYADYAFNLMAAQQFSDCLPYAEKAADLVPNAMQYRMLKGDCEAGVDPKSAVALTDYQAAQKLDDHKDTMITSRLLASIGNVMLYQGNIAGGLQAINQAETVDPKAPYAYQYQATYYINSGNLNAALNPLIQLSQVQPQNVQAQINIGDIYVRQRNYAAAQAAYAKAQQIDPKSGDAAFGLAEIPAAQGDIKDIDAPLQKAISLSPGSTAVYNSSIAQLLLNQTADKVDHSTDALRYADAATKADPNYGWGWYSLGIAYADQHKNDQANSALRTAFNIFKAKNDIASMQTVDKQWTALNGANNSLMNGQGVNEKTNQPGQSSGG